MPKTPLYIVALLAGCADSEPVSIASGDYRFVSVETEEVDADLSDYVLSVDVDALSLSISGVDYEAGLTRLAEEDWEVACPTNFAAVDLETFQLDTPLTLLDTELSEPLLFAEGCQGDQGTTAEQIWLSTAENSNSIGTGLFLLAKE